MISRRGIFDGHSTDELDGLLRWVLRESVAGAVAPSHVWPRIRGDAQRLAALRRAWIWRVSDLVRQVVVACLSRVNGLLPMLELPPVQGDGSVMLGYDLGWVRLLDHHRLSCSWYARLGT